MNIRKLNRPKKVLINLDAESFNSLKKIKSKTGKSKSYLVRDAIKHMDETIEIFSSMTRLKKKD